LSTGKRISDYCRVLNSLCRGEYTTEIPVDKDGQYSEFAESLRTLTETLQHRFDEIETLSRITDKINQGVMLEDVLNETYESFRTIIPYDRIGFSLLEDNNRIVRAVWARSESPEIKLGYGYCAEMAGSSLQQIIETGKPRILNDLEGYLREKPESESTQLVVEEGMRASLTCPLIAMGKPIGFLFFSSMSPHKYENVHVDIFLKIANQLAVIVEKGRLCEELIELNELKNKFLGMAAHDLRSPITAIKGFASILERGLLGEVPQQQKDILTRIENASQRMLALVNDLLDVSAIESGQFEIDIEKVDIADCLQDSYETNKLLAENKSIHLALEIESDLPPIFLDTNRVRQVMDNLVGNAILYGIVAYALVDDAFGRPYTAIVSAGMTTFYVAHVVAFLHKKLSDRALLTALLGLSGVCAAWTIPLSRI